MDKRLLTIQDISCVGQCSITVALPVISACGIETAILPSSVLSNHTAEGFNGWTFCDLSNEMPKILRQWIKEKIDFDAFYTGYVNKTQIPYIIEIMDKVARPGALKIVDPVMADNGKLYAGFDKTFPKEMLKLIKKADFILPNITEATFLLEKTYPEAGYDRAYIEKLMKELYGLGCRNIILTGVSFEADKLGVAVYDGVNCDYYFSERLNASMHGTGDLYASVFAGSLLRGKSPAQAAAIAVDFVVRAMKNTLNDKSHWYGVKFEEVIPYLIELLLK